MRVLIIQLIIYYILYCCVFYRFFHEEYLNFFKAKAEFKFWKKRKSKLEAKTLDTSIKDKHLINYESACLISAILSVILMFVFFSVIFPEIQDNWIAAIIILLLFIFTIIFTFSVHSFIWCERLLLRSKFKKLLTWIFDLLITLLLAAVLLLISSKIALLLEDKPSHIANFILILGLIIVVFVIDIFLLFRFFWSSKWKERKLIPGQILNWMKDYERDAVEKKFREAKKNYKKERKKFKSSKEASN